ncbi:RNA dependent RNA polymerase-domain-containing protein [Sordaria brevicollis]|uniref:RNA-directed RNA polymerase n=1 Tax=Sordaria brevicollis TaxID=83679 RepID=A0AAE0NWF4_SORBR|nr:RNA dependent RNA polymerase-domain-containing protein [Sordaria brevicollis]
MSGIPSWVEQAQHAALVSPEGSPRDRDARPRHSDRRRSSQQRRTDNTTASQAFSRPPSRPPSRPSSGSPKPPPRAVRQYSRGKLGQFSSTTPPLKTIFIPTEWKRAKSACIRVKDVPPEATLRNFYDLFSEYGRIVRIELDENRPDIPNHDRRAFIRFEPPPLSTDFLHRGVCRLTIGYTDHWLPLELVDAKRETPKGRTIKTKLGNSCPEKLYLLPSSMSFGVLVQPAEFMRKQTVQTLSSDSLLKLDFDFRNMRLEILFSLQYPRGPNGFRRPSDHYKLEIKFGNIKELCRTIMGKERRQALVMTLRDPPVAYRKKDVSASFGDDRLTWSEKDLLERVVEIIRGRDVSENPISLSENHQYIDLGRWLTYWIELDQHSTKVWDQVQEYLLDWNLKTKLNVFSEPLPNQRPAVWDLLEDGYGHSIQRLPSQSWDHDLSLLSAPARISLPFDVRYQLEACISQGIINEHNIDRPFLKKLMELSHNDNSLQKDRARLVLEYAADHYAGKRIFNPMDLFDDRAAMEYFPSSYMIPPHCARVRRVTVTPTRIYFSTPCIEPTNRVIRRWKHAQDYFIRIQFTDELLEGRIRNGETELPVFLRAYRALDKGIAMGPWRWKFLAFGNSQFRESGAFMFCEQGNLTCDTMRAWMGRFSHIKIIAKYAARLGQCFSTTRSVPGILVPTIVTIPDIEKNGFCFTDGVGKISPLLAQMVADDWKLHDTPPSAYQFRMGGCKGILVVWPDVKHTEVHIRKSQEKFVAEFNGLEIIKCAKFTTAKLNRQIISILSSLGVPDQVFVDMMEKELAEFNAAMEDRQEATKLLRKSIDENHITPIIADMLNYGFMESKEPFVRNLLRLWRSWSIKTLKEKARLNVEKGAFVLGCVDETGTLKGHMRVIEGSKDVPSKNLPQIFLQVSHRKGDDKIITGTCIVGRNPSLHPGDIRVVEAVDVPALRHLRNVVVFPSTGDRDVPSMCSGGDLDGDDFFVIWDPLLIPSEHSHPPMINEPVVGKEMATEPTVNNLISFFVLYMKYNNLGQIAHAHLATADAEMDGAKNPKCLELANLHSMAVDYVKTGVPAEFPRRLDPRSWPHFMEKNKRTYHSDKALGKLYDMVERETFDMRENYQLPFDKRILKHTKCRALRDETLTKARRLKSQYDTDMRRIMSQLEIATEFEVWTAFVMSKPRVGTDYKLQENVGRESSALKQRFQAKCKKEAGSDLLSFVSAMYRVTDEEVRIALHEVKKQHVKPDGSVGTRKISPKSMPLVSFPWLFWDKLGQLARAGAIMQRKFDDGSEDMDLLSDIPLVSHRRRGKHTGSGSCEILEENGEQLPLPRTRDGRVIHYGEVLNLFSHDDEEDETIDVVRRNSSSEESAPDDSTKSDTNLEPVAEEDLLSFESPPASPVVKPASPDVDLLGPLPTPAKAELATGLTDPVPIISTPQPSDKETVIHNSHSNPASDPSASTSSEDLEPPTPETSMDDEDLLDIYSATPPRARNVGITSATEGTVSVKEGTPTQEVSSVEEDLLLDDSSVSPPRPTGIELGSADNEIVPVKGGPPEPPIWVEQVVRMGHRIPTPPSLETTAIPAVDGPSQPDSPVTGTITASNIHDPFVSPPSAVVSPVVGGGSGGGNGPVNQGVMMGLDGGMEKKEAAEESDEEVEEVELEVGEDTLESRVAQMASL